MSYVIRWSLGYSKPHFYRRVFWFFVCYGDTDRPECRQFVQRLRALDTEKV